MILPATAPTMISIRATEIAAQIDIRDAARARPIHRADASQTLSIANLFSSSPAASSATHRPGHAGGGGWRRATVARQLGGKEIRLRHRQTYRPYFTVGVISLTGGFGGPHPHSMQ